MLRRVLSVVVLMLCGTSSASAQGWAQKMFTETSHDFGTVARDAKAEYRFQFKNIYKETLHVAGVRSSCGCTTPVVTKNELKSLETGEVVATFNTRAFTGSHSATLTVTFDQPFYAEVQLNVWGNIRGDVMVQPGVIDLGIMDQGQEADRKVTVTHFGNSNWTISDVRSLNTNYEVEVIPGPRGGSQVSYELKVHVKNSMPSGYIKDQLILLTNDAATPQFSIDVEGIVNAELTISPQSLSMGTMEPGQKITKNLIVHGKRPFKIVSVHCDDDSFSFKVPEAMAKMQMIPVTFIAAGKPGKVTRKIHIETDLGKDLVPDVVVQAQIKTGSDSPDKAPADDKAPTDSDLAPSKAPTGPSATTSPAKTDAANSGSAVTDTVQSPDGA